MNARIGRNLSFFQVDFDITQETAAITGPTPDITDEALLQVESTNTDAGIYWTIYPKGGLDSVTDAKLDDLVARIKTAISTGRYVFFRYAPEMNGNWFAYGQQPEKFVTHWRYVVTHIRKGLGDLSSKVAMIWAPNSGNGYPFLGGKFENKTFTATLNPQSDPYGVYYPGDDYVDWVGLSVYHYGSAWPWRQNTPPAPGEFEALVTGNQPCPKPWSDWGCRWPFYDFYGMFSGDGTGSAGQLKLSAPVSKGGKPFIVAETASTYHYGWNMPVWTAAPDYNASLASPNVTFPATRLEMKQPWWQQIFAFATNRPKFKAVCSFEFIKSEEDTLRDFTMFGAPGPTFTAGFGADNAIVANAFTADSAKYNIKWASYLANPGIPGINGTTGGAAAGTSTVSGSSAGPSSTGATSSKNAAVSGSQTGTSFVMAILVVMIWNLALF